MKVNDFLAGVYDWLSMPRNTPVAELHECCASAMTKRDFRKFIGSFLRQRFYQMYGGWCADSSFIYRAVNKYIANMFS